MRPYSTQYFKEYCGKNAYIEVTKDFYELAREIDNSGIALRKPKTQPFFEKDEKGGKNFIAEDVVLLADEMPLAEVYLKGIKWGDKKDGEFVASLSISIRHFKGLEAKFPRFEELKNQFNLNYKGTYQSSNG